ncbi:carbohydrate kinase family protein [Agromyces soli]
MDEDGRAGSGPTGDGRAGDRPRGDAARIDVVGGFTIDAIVHGDGAVTTQQLGGNALWASMGIAALAGGLPRAHTVVGADYPGDALGRIAARGIDVGGVRHDPSTRTARVSFAYRADGTRTQPAPADAIAEFAPQLVGQVLDTTRDPAVTLASLPDADALLDHGAPPALRWHLGLLPLVRFAAIAPAVRRAGARYMQADCPQRSELARDGDAVLREHLHHLDVFLPSTSDTDVFAPGVDHDTLLERFHDYGAPVVVLKRGERGALVSDARSRHRWSIPAFPAQADDATGAGDVFCGAFAHALTTGGDLVAAAVEASVCASYALEAASPLELRAPDPTERAARRAHIQSGVEEL